MMVSLTRVRKVVGRPEKRIKTRGRKLAPGKKMTLSLELVRARILERWKRLGRRARLGELKGTSLEEEFS